MAERGPGLCTSGRGLGQRLLNRKGDVGGPTAKGRSQRSSSGEPGDERDPGVAIETTKVPRCDSSIGCQPSAQGWRAAFPSRGLWRSPAASLEDDSVCPPGTRIKISSSNKQEVPTEAGRAAGQEPGMKPGGGWSAGGGGGDERHSGEDADGAAGTLPAEPGGWWACGRHGVLLFAAGRPRPRYHRAHLEARRCRPGREIGDARRSPPLWEALVQRRAHGVGPPAGLRDCLCAGPFLHLSESVSYPN